MEIVFFFFPLSSLSVDFLNIEGQNWKAYGALLSKNWITSISYYQNFIAIATEVAELL